MAIIIKKEQTVGVRSRKGTSKISKKISAYINKSAVLKHMRGASKPIWEKCGRQSPGHTIALFASQLQHLSQAAAVLA